ncbi:MAG: RidA family protein [SAR202 cluster bacterium]|jgi:enamine deaminase RidA (YjgF/YER057c/UK114 family)|nr:RidA family protein [SAR202 cluster bacterium]MDP6514554.1 RidA family protein [SAR202 cluster bacterium]MDP6715198.1 RidA family protein [SAR202 cluster bacterium]
MDKTRKEYPDIAPAGPTYARAVRAGDTFYVSGCTARGTSAEGGSAMDQLKVTLGRVVRIVEAEGGTAQDIVKITTFVTKMSDWFPVDQAQIDLFNEYFDGQNPANSLVEITALALPGLDIEIEAIAVLG